MTPSHENSSLSRGNDFISIQYTVLKFEHTQGIGTRLQAQQDTSTQEIYL